MEVYASQMFVKKILHFLILFPHFCRVAIYFIETHDKVVFDTVVAIAKVQLKRCISKRSYAEFFFWQSYTSQN